MRQSYFLWLALGFVALTGCRKDPIDALSEEEQRIYITHKDPGANFSNYKTFTVAEQVVVVQQNGGQTQYTPSDRAIVEALTAGLQSRRFTRTASNASPDLGVQVTRIIQTSTGVMTIGNYWDFWDPFWGNTFGGGWGWGAPAWGVATYQVQEGMLAVDIVDLKNRSTNGNARVLWNGLVRGPGLTTVGAAQDIAENLLRQSPYLQTN